jgi:transcriptional regulator with XRE-family HTH domain
MTARILPFPSRGLARQGCERRGQRATPARHVVKVVGLDRAPGKVKNAFERIRSRTPTSNFPVVPNLANRSDLGRSRVEGQPLGFAPCTKGRVFGGLYHTQPSKLISYTLTSHCKRVSGSFVSANVLQFRPMSDDPNRIRELRSAIKMSQQELGNRAGCSKMTISDLERGNMELTLTYMRRIAPALGVEIADLLPRSDNPYALDANERKYLERFRVADKDQRETLERVTDAIVPTERPAERAA